MFVDFLVAIARKWSQPYMCINTYMDNKNIVNIYNVNLKPERENQIIIFF